MFKKYLAVFIVALFAISFLETGAFARAGGGRSFGSRGSRTYSAPARPSSPAAPPQGMQAPAQTVPPQAQPPAGGGFMRALAGGILGGMIGSLLFSSLGFAGGTGGLFGGIGVFEIILILLGVFMIFRLMRPRQAPEQGYYNSRPDGFERPSGAAAPSYGPIDSGGGQAGGLTDIKRADGSFDEAAFREAATDVFFKVQSAWMGREISPIVRYLTPEIEEAMRGDVRRLIQEGRINRLENIAMRSVEITEAWQEEGRDFITVKILANVLDYVTDEAGGLVEGSRTEPVKFVEFWTFTRPVGGGDWKLTAIQQDS